MKKIAIFAFNGDLMCFSHVLLNALDLHEKGHDVKLIIEGSATKLIADFQKPKTAFYELFNKCVSKGILDAVCMACAAKMKTLKICKEKGYPLAEDMSGHPSMEKYIASAYEIITLYAAE
jgi:hypothetical protein